MNKQEFLDNLRSALSGLPQDCIDESLLFYSEMIDDRIEEGLTEEEATAEIGSIEDIAAQIISDIPLLKIAKEKIRPKHKMKAWEIVLLSVGSPVWISLLVAAFAVVFSIVVSLWAVIASLWTSFAAFAGGTACGVAAGIILICTSNIFGGIALIACSLVLSGLSIFAFFGCKAATRGMAILTKKIALGIKRLLVRKERV